MDDGHMGARYAHPLAKSNPQQSLPHVSVNHSLPRIRLIANQRNLGGRGRVVSRKFWRECLPRLKYHNPSIPMIVNRHDQNQSSPLLTIYLRTKSATDGSPSAQPASSRTNLSKAQPPGPNEKTVAIDMKNKHSSDILEYFIAETRAKPVQASKEEIAEMQYLGGMKKQAEIDRERVRQLRAEKKKEEEMLKRARAAGGMAEQDEA